MAEAVLNNYQVFPREYFSGVDCYIAFNNIVIDEIVTLQFGVQEPIIPIYGYASYTYDAVAHGARIVSGSLAITFKESFYIRSILQKLEGQNISSKAPKTIRDTSMSTAELLAWLNKKQRDDIQKLAETYASKLWTKGTDEVVNKQIQPFFTTAGSDLSEYGFDIVLVYGKELVEVGKPIKNYTNKSTVKYINGVHLTGVTQRVAPSGEPIYEEYSFIAKDLDNTI
jgi:hypothetical protein